MPSAGQRVRAVDFPSSATDTQNTSGTTTSTSFTATLSGGTACSVTFTAPTSGNIQVVNSASISNSTTQNTWVSWELRTGSTPGSGTAIASADNNRALTHNGTTSERASIVDVWTGLSAGTVYNVRQMYRVSSGTGTFVSKSLSVIPVP